jgi:hypothetical protein
VPTGVEHQVLKKYKAEQYNDYEAKMLAGLNSDFDINVCKVQIEENARIVVQRIMPVKLALYWPSKIAALYQVHPDRELLFCARSSRT